MKLLLLNEYYHPTIQNMVYYFASLLGPNSFNWTGKRFYRKDFLPLNELEESSCIPEYEALTKLQNGEYDFVIMSDSSTYIYLSSHLPSLGTKRIFIDTTDTWVIPRYYWENSEIYFKAQYREHTIIANKKEIHQKNLIDSSSLDKLYPFSLGTSFKVSEIKSVNNSTKNFDVFFNGSAWPKDRIKFINTIKSEGAINFHGGLFNRNDLEFNNVVPDHLKSKALSRFEHMYSILSSKINLNIRGNGENCFRQFEIMCLGGFLLTQECDNYFGHEVPINKEHCVFYKKDGSNLLEIIKYYLNNEKERNEIAKRGQDFYNKKFHPQEIIKYILNAMVNSSL